MHHITHLLENNAYVQCLLVDFSKAFDVVSHEILINKLTALQLPPFVLSWIRSFVRNRTQMCKVGDELSAQCRITRSIIQGSGLGLCQVVFSGFGHATPAYREAPGV